MCLVSHIFNTGRLRNKGWWLRLVKCAWFHIFTMLVHTAGCATKADGYGSSSVTDSPHFSKVAG